MKTVRGGLILAAIVAVLGLAAGYWHFSDLLPQRDRAAVESGPSATPQEISPSPDPTELDADRVDGGSQHTALDGNAPQSPSIDLVRVEPDGSTLVAGQAEPMSDIVIRDGETIVARERAGPTGDFAATLDLPLAVGDHQLSVQSTHSDGSVRPSSEVAIVSVPPRGREQDLLVALGAPNAPTQLLAVPSAPPGAAGSAPTPNSTPAARLDGGEPVPSAGNAEVPPPALASSPSSELSVAAVEIEDDTLYIAGTARPGASVRIYLDEAFVAQALGRDGGQFIAQSDLDVSVGSHIVRVDQLSPDGSVVARVAVPFDRPEGTSMAALAPRPGAAGSTGGRTSGDSAPTQDGRRSEAAGELNPGSVAGGAEAAARSQLNAELRGSVSASEVREPGEGAPVMQAALEPVEGRVIIRRGDTLWRISRQTYGMGSRYTVIYLANGDQIVDPDRIYPGQVFRVPDGVDEVRVR